MIIKCAFCKKEFKTFPCKIRKRKVLTCSFSCKKKAQVGRRMSIERRLFKHIEKKPSGCWEWNGLRRDHKLPYGRIWINKRQKTVHRVAYEVFKGKIPKGLLVCHICDNPPCINPNHLFLGTQKDNSHDRDKKGRWIDWHNA